MARFRRNLSPINSRKHIVQLSPTTIAFGAIRNQQIVSAVDTADSSVAIEVDVGASVKAVFVELWVTSDDTAQSSAIITLEKVPRVTDLMTFAEAGGLHDYFNKNNIYYITQGITTPNVQSAVPFLRGWFKIPKGKQRMDKESAIVLNIAALTNGLTVCGTMVYKSYQ